VPFLDFLMMGINKQRLVPAFAPLTDESFPHLITGSVGGLPAKPGTDWADLNQIVNNCIPRMYTKVNSQSSKDRLYLARTENIPLGDSAQPKWVWTHYPLQKRCAIHYSVNNPTTAAAILFRKPVLILPGQSGCRHPHYHLYLHWLSRVCVQQK